MFRPISLKMSTVMCVGSWPVLACLIKNVHLSCVWVHGLFWPISLRMFTVMCVGSWPVLAYLIENVHCHVCGFVACSGLSH